MRILVIDRSTPSDVYQGNALIGWHVFSRLKERHELGLICPAPADQIPALTTTLRTVFKHVYMVPRQSRPTAIVGAMEPKLSRIERPRVRLPFIDAAGTRAFQEQVRDVIASGAWDVIHVRQLPMAGYLDGIADRPFLLELVDSETLQSRRRLQPRSPKSPVRLLIAAAIERSAARRANIVTVVSDADARAIRRLAPGTRVEVVANGVDTQFFSPVQTPEDPRSVVFTGAMSFPPNIDTVVHFHDHILPLIRRSAPDIRFYIVGRDPHDNVQRLAATPGVTVTGFVPDIRPWLARASLFVCPMRTGSGIKNKVLEAFAMGTPVVSTSRGVEAINVTHDRNVFVVDDDAGFAGAVVRLLEDDETRARLGAAGRDLAVQHYSWDATATRYEALYESLIESSRAGAR